MNTKNAVFATILIFFITLEVLIARNYLSQQDRLREERTAIYNAVVELQNEVGFVGLIHNFKNYLLRPDESHYRDDAIQNYETALRLTADIEELGQSILGDTELVETRKMLDAFRERLDRMPGYIEQGMTAREIDVLVRHDDYPAHQEIEQISRRATMELEAQLSTTLYRSLTFGLIASLILFASLALLIRFFFNAQEKSLASSRKLNAEMTTENEDLIRAQNSMLNVIHDLNEEKGRTNDLQKLNEEMQQFIYTVSHDLKSPLVTIGGFSKTLVNELEGTITEKQAHRLQRIYENANQMEQLLADLLELSRVVQQDLVKEPVDTDAIVDTQCEALEGMINQADATINVQKPLHVVHANERLLSQCLSNLLTNAIHYRDPARSLVIDVSSEDTDSHIVLSIQDNGIGIDSKYHQSIFRIFERLSTNKKGTGVGLAIVKAVMEKQRGKVTLDSEPGKGCRFNLFFPKLA